MLHLYIYVFIEETDIHKLIVCQKANARLSCNDNKVIHILTAMYGRKERDPGSCPCRSGGKHLCNTNCGSQDSFKRVQDECDGHKSCQFKAGNAFFGNPCRHTRKYLELEYQCALKQGM